LEPGRQINEDYKSVDHREIIDLFLSRLRSEFEAVADPKAPAQLKRIIALPVDSCRR
jgi:hypothetical protein